MTFTLTISKGPDDGTAFSFDEKEARLGRTADNHIVVKDGGASRSHCRVYEEEFRYFLEDLKSANGTKLNGTLITVPMQLKSGDTISIGDVSFLFTLPEATMMQPSLMDEPAADANKTMIGAPLAMPIPDPEPSAPPADPNATMLKSPAELEALKESWKLKAEPPKSEEPKVDANATMLKSPAELEALKASWGKSGLPQDTGPIDAPPEVVGDATMPPKRPTTRPGAQKKPSDSTAETPAHEVEGALARASRDEGLQPSGGDSTKEVAGLPGRAALKAKKVAEPEPAALSAADKARMKRELGGTIGGRAKLFWSGLSKRGQLGVKVGGGAFGALTVGLLVWALIPADDPNKKVIPPEPAVLANNANPIEYSFGLGDDVTYKRADLKMFTFTTQSPTKVVVLLHYYAKDISKDEVAITLNAGDVGMVAADTMDVANRDLEVVFPSKLVKPREENTVTFDNLRNPPGSDPWRIWNVWLEVLPIPELSPEQTVAEARNSIDRGKKAYELREVGPENLYKAWKQYREAWLLLESMDDRPKEIYEFVRMQIKQIQPEMDRRCSTLLLQVQQELQSPNANYKRVRDMLEAIPNYFPTREHRCFGISKAMLGDLPG